MVRGTPSKRRASKAARKIAEPAAPAAGGPKKRRGRPPLRRDPELDEAEPGAYVIRRYGNRRLYDTRRKRAITATEVAELIRKGEDVCVQDGDTGFDVTKRFLVQLILEEHNARQLELLPAELLRVIVSSPKAPYTAWLTQYLEAGADWINREATQIAQHLSPPAALEQLWKAWGRSAPWATFGGGVGGDGGRRGDAKRDASPPPPTPKAPHRDTGYKNTQDELRDEMAELQRRLADLASKMPRR
jgi:polyhydroxyalkanoate synthesis repressor PhaR